MELYQGLIQQEWISGALLPSKRKPRFKRCNTNSLSKLHTIVTPLIVAYNTVVNYYDLKRNLYTYISCYALYLQSDTENFNVLVKLLM